MHKGRGLNLTDEVNEYINKATDSKKMRLSHKK